MPSIQYLYAREILDSRGLPTVECSLWLDTGHKVTSSVPTGTSVGKYEALEIRDKDPSRMRGLGVLRAVNNINQLIAPQLQGQNPQEQQGIDQLLIQLDGSPNKAKLGANAILAVSQAVLKAGALVSGLEPYTYIAWRFGIQQPPHIPNCVYSVINGGKHGAGNLDYQEFQLIPASNLDFSTSLEMAVTFFHRLGEVLISKNAIHSYGVGGGYAPNLYNNADAFEILLEASKATPYTVAQDVFLGLDVAASAFYSAGKYNLKDKSQAQSSEELLDEYLRLKKLYHLMYLEDPFHEDDEKSWTTLTAQLGENTAIVGDSLLVTNKERTQKAIEDKLCNAILVKPNQVGTITETVEVVQLARQAGWQIIISHRSGETNDDLIADLAVGLAADYVKFGPPNRGERVVKYNRLAMIALWLKQAQAAQAQQAGGQPQQAQTAQAPITQGEPAATQTQQ